MDPGPSRRAALGATLGAALALPLLTGCSVDRLSLDGLRAPTPATPPAPPNPDEPLVRDMVEQITRLAATTGDPWHALHLAQLRALGHTKRVAAAPSASAGAAADGPERRLRGRLLTACVSARSPELACLLASMAAGIDQVLRSAS